MAYFKYDGAHCCPLSSWWQPATVLPWAPRPTPSLGCCAQHDMQAALLSAYLDARSYKPRSGTVGPWCTSNLSLLSNFPADFHGCCTNNLQSHQQFPSTSLAPHIPIVFLMMPILTGIRLNRNITLICILLVVQCGEQFFMYLFGHLYFFWELSVQFIHIY